MAGAGLALFPSYFLNENGAGFQSTYLPHYPFNHFCATNFNGLHQSSASFCLPKWAFVSTPLLLDYFSKLR